MQKTQAEQTVNGDYESIDYHTFKGVAYDRTMAWKTGSGNIGVGVQGQITSRKTDMDKEDEILPAGQTVVVMNMNFKLVRAS